MKRIFPIFKSIEFILIALLVATYPFMVYAVGNGEKLADKVESEIANYYYNEFTIEVDKKGNVDIRGEVNTLFDKYRIFEIVSRVKGVQTITNNIVVDTKELPDKIIQNNVQDELNYVTSILEPERINVKVDNGVVFLSGQVSYNREKRMARTVASWQEGVTGIVNEIQVLPPQKAKSDENLKDILSNILEDRFATEEEVNFSIENGVVTLTGTANDLWSKKEIEKQFSDVIGVKKVVNNLNVKKYNY